VRATSFLGIGYSVGVTLEEFKKKAKKIPDAPGVYFFLDKRRRLLYIGKAASLRDRVRSYFSPDLFRARGPLLVQMLKKASLVDWRKTDSVLEALLLEASLVRGHKPIFNTELKDDKSFNYVVIIKEDFPRVLVVREKELKTKNLKFKNIFGPFPNGGQLKDALKLVRKIFPYRDSKCKPGQKRPCFNRQIGLCPGVCIGEITKRKYGKTIQHITLLFEGKKKRLLKTLTKEMKSAAKEENFEVAKELRRQIFALQHIQDVSLIKDEYRSHSTLPGAIRPGRIESYDIAHFGGSANVGVMTVVEDGAANKNEYRKFRIKAAKPGDDTSALREVLARRLGHDEWPLPRLIIVDGARAQINAAQKVLEEYGINIPVVGVIKDDKHRPRGILGPSTSLRVNDFIRNHEREILLANAEAHRFAITYHRKRSRKNLGIL